jgi:phosphatidylglycerophosphatase A
VVVVTVMIRQPTLLIKRLHLLYEFAYDFKFTYQGKTFGIGAKKTLRERYKQFIKTARTTEIDVTIEITIGLDLNEEKAKTIAQHDTVLFISDEIYQQREFFKTMNSVYSVKDLTLDTLKKIANIK